MKLLKICMKYIPYIFMNFCLVSHAMESISLPIKYSFNPPSFGKAFEKIAYLSFTQGLTEVDKSFLTGIINGHLTPQQRERIGRGCSIFFNELSFHRRYA